MKESTGPVGVGTRTGMRAATGLLCSVDLGLNGLRVCCRSVAERRESSWSER